MALSPELNSKQRCRRRDPIIVLVALLSLAATPPSASAFHMPSADSTALRRGTTGLSHRPAISRKQRAQLGKIVFTPSQMSSIPSDGSFSLDSLMSSDELNQMAQTVSTLMRKDDPRAAFQVLTEMIQFLQNATVKDRRDRLYLSEMIDESFQAYSRYAFAAPFQGRSNLLRIAFGVKALNLQLSSGSALEAPYNTIPKPLLLSALKALTGIKGLTYSESIDEVLRNTDAAYRVLQRLVTGNGVRYAKPSNLRIFESDFNMVLNAYCSIGRMDMAHRIVALQKRTPHAPPLSAVAYSILLKGYGKLADVQNVEMIMSQAQSSQVIPDVIMLNSLIDAYISCNEVNKALALFDFMKNPNDKTSEYYALFPYKNCPQPNKTTFNTMLKGLAASSSPLQKSIDLSEDMMSRGMWDDVSTNTLVQTAVACGDFQMAEEILETESQHEVPRSNNRNRYQQHPNLEAYTSLIDGYGKAGLPDNAMQTLKTMESRGIDPSDITYTCLIGALAKNRKFKKAQNFLSYMRSAGVKPTAVTYNAFISGLLAETKKEDNVDQLVDDAILVLQDMVQERIKPNSITLSTIINGFARCSDPRVQEAETLVSKFDEGGIISKSELRIVSAMLNIYGAAGDIEKAKDTLATVSKPDVPVINSYLDAISKCENYKLVIETFDFYFRNNKNTVLEPNLISFTILIGAVARSERQRGSQLMGRLYEEMKARRVHIDKVFVDT